MSRPAMLVVAVLVAAGSPRAQPASQGQRFEPGVQVKEHRLANGMKWLIVERHGAPVFTGFVRVRVGGADEVPGSTGLAHLFEHMAFKGTPVLGTRDYAGERGLLEEIAQVGDQLAALERAQEGQSGTARELRAAIAKLERAHRELTDENALAELYLQAGAVGLNASTDKDVTSYRVSLPKNRLELWALLEASRLAAPVLRDFYRERDVVLEERRTSIESSPSGRVREELNQLAFVMSPYRWPVVGYAEDLAAMTMRDAMAFHRRHYTPANAVGCLVGDVRTEEVIALLERTFGVLPAAPIPPAPTFAEPRAQGTRRAVIAFDAAPQLSLAFRTPPGPSQEDDALQALQALLGAGRTSRLHRRLVVRGRLAHSVTVGTTPGSRFEHLLVINAAPLAGVSVTQVERAIWDELERLKSTPVQPTELEKVQNRAAAQVARLTDSNEALASALSASEAVLGSWRHALDAPERLSAVTTADLQRVARKYLDPRTAVTVELRRPSGSKEEGQ